MGVTTWNSELFLEHCLRSIHRTTEGLRIRIGVVDNFSSDRSVEIARDMRADVRVERCSQAIALNRLLSMSRARHTLLIHSDVILLSPELVRDMQQAPDRTCCAGISGRHRLWTVDQAVRRRHA